MVSKVNKTIVIIAISIAFLVSMFSCTSELKSTDTSFTWQDGYGESVTVEFENFVPADTIDIILTDLVSKSMSKAQYRLKNPLSFVPTKLHIMPFEGKIVCSVSMRGKNAFGTESNNTSRQIYSSTGEFIREF